MATLSGTTKDMTGALAQRLVRVYRADTGSLVSSVMSNQTTGAWSITTADTSEHFAIMHDRSGDLLYPQVGVLLSFNSNLLDAKGHTFAVNGSASISSARSAYSGGSSYLGGSTGYLSAASSADFDCGTGDFCFEAHVYATGDGAIFSKRADYMSSESFSLAVVYSSQTLVFSYSSTGSNDLGISSSSWVMPVNVWAHVCIERYNGVITMRINGVARGSRTTSAASFTSSEPLLIGATKNGGAPTGFFAGNINGFRFTKAARYKGDFTSPSLPTTPLTTQSIGTQNAVIYDRLIPV